MLLGGFLPRWIGTVVLLFFGVWAIYHGMTGTDFYIRGVRGPLPLWLGRTFHITLGVSMIIGGVLVIVGPF